MNQPRTEIYLPCSADDLRSWALNVGSTSPVGSTPADDYVEVQVEIDLHAGIELTFTVDDLPLHTVAIFGSPNEAELEAEVTG